MRKFIITAAASAALAVPTAAMATVTYDGASGTTSIGKGDVQSALGYANDAAFQADAQLPGKITFSLSPDITSMIWSVQCAPHNADGSFDYSRIHEISVNAGTLSTTANTPNVKVLTSKQGKVTGYTQTVTPGETTWVGAIDNSKPLTSCPGGEYFYEWVNPGLPWESVTVPGILKVSNGVKTAELPVTPVV